MEGVIQNTNISAHGDSIKEANVNPTNPHTNQNTNQYTNISAHGDSIEEAEVNPTKPTNPSTNQNTNQYTNISAHGLGCAFRRNSGGFRRNSDKRHRWEQKLTGTDRNRHRNVL